MQVVEVTCLICLALSMQDRPRPAAFLVALVNHFKMLVCLHECIYFSSYIFLELGSFVTSQRSVLFALKHKNLRIMEGGIVKLKVWFDV